jgi:hypothetical protein
MTGKSSSTLPGIASLAARKPPKQGNPSLISQHSKQTKPISLPKIWGKGG